VSRCKFNVDLSIHFLGLEDHMRCNRQIGRSLPRLAATYDHVPHHAYCRKRGQVLHSRDSELIARDMVIDFELNIHITVWDRFRPTYCDELIVDFYNPVHSVNSIQWELFAAMLRRSLERHGARQLCGMRLHQQRNSSRPSRSHRHVVVKRIPVANGQAR